MSGAVWRDKRVRGILWQALLLLALAGAAWFLVGTLLENLAARRITTGFDFLWAPAGFDIAFKPFSFAPTDRIVDALRIGLANTLMVALIAALFATLLGFALGFLAVPDNPLVQGLVRAYVEFNRNTPLLVQLFFWYGLITLTFPTVRAAQPIGPGILLTNRGLFLPTVDVGAAAPAALVCAVGFAISITAWRFARAFRERTGRTLRAVALLPLVTIGIAAAILIQGGATFAVDYPQLRGFNIRGGLSLSPELAALILGLTLYTSAFIAEIVRGAIASIARGQWDAARALGLRTTLALRFVIAPQALRIIVPPLASQYINVAKNATLAAAIGFPDFVLIVNTVISQTNQAIEGVLLIVLVYLVINLTVSLFLNWFNARVAIKER